MDSTKAIFIAIIVFIVVMFSSLVVITAIQAEVAETAIAAGYNEATLPGLEGAYWVKQ